MRNLVLILLIIGLIAAIGLAAFVLSAWHTGSQMAAPGSINHHHAATPADDQPPPVSHAAATDPPLVIQTSPDNGSAGTTLPPAESAERSYVCTGRVIDGDGQPVAGALVAWTAADDYWTADEFRDWIGEWAEDSVGISFRRSMQTDAVANGCPHSITADDGSFSLRWRLPDDADRSA